MTTKEYYWKNKEKCNESGKKWREANLEKIKRYRELNPNYIKQWKENNKEHIKEYNKKNEKRKKEYHKEWINKNPDINRICQKKYYDAHYKTDIKPLQKIRNATRFKYGKAKICWICGGVENVEHHHFKPYMKDDFIDLCTYHHKLIHKKL